MLLFASGEAHLFTDQQKLSRTDLEGCSFDYNRTRGRLCEDIDFTSQSAFLLKQTTQIEKDMWSQFKRTLTLGKNEP